MPQAICVVLQTHTVMSEWERDQEAHPNCAGGGESLRHDSMRDGTPGRHTAERQAAARSVVGRLEELIAGFKARGLFQRVMVEELNLPGVWATQGGTWRSDSPRDFERIEVSQ